MGWIVELETSIVYEILEKGIGYLLLSIGQFVADHHSWFAIFEPSQRARFNT
jgi:hypothetical protein